MNNTFFKTFKMNSSFFMIPSFIALSLHSALGIAQPSKHHIDTLKIVADHISIYRNQLSVNKGNIEMLYTSDAPLTDSAKLYVNGQEYIKSGSVPALGSLETPPKKVLLTTEVPTVSSQDAALEIASSIVTQQEKSSVVQPSSTPIIIEKSPVVTVTKEVQKTESVVPVVTAPKKSLFTKVEASPKQDITTSSAFTTTVLKERLAQLNANTALNVVYYPEVEAKIRQLLDQEKPYLEQLIAKKSYYFQQFEEELSHQSLPQELKYVAVVNSALNPKATENGYAGLWGLTATDAVRSGLVMNQVKDERLDPSLATKTAVSKLGDLYQEHKNWDVALLANRVPASTFKTFDTNKDQQVSLWEAMQQTSTSEQSYLPNLLAHMYLLEYADAHGLGKNYEPLQTSEVVSYEVDQAISLQQLTQTLGVGAEELAFLNPSYVSDLVPASAAHTATLKLPITKATAFLNEKAKIYELSKQPTVTGSQTAVASAPKIVVLPKLTATPDAASAPVTVTAPKNEVVTYRTTDNLNDKATYKVTKGDYLNKIARTFNTSIDHIKSWNNLAGNSISIGQELILKGYRNVSSTISDLSKNGFDSELLKVGNQSKDISAPIVQMHTVVSGETLWGIARKYGVTVEQLRSWNKLGSDAIDLGTQLRLQP